MKKLKKLSLKSMKESFRLVDEAELKNIVGGGYLGSFPINGGVVNNYSVDGQNFAVFTSDDGRAIVLDGVIVNSNTYAVQPADSAASLFGVIRIGSGYDTFSYSNLMHEYGHYLQSIVMGASFYTGSIESAVDLLMNQGVGHYNMSFEVDATNRGKSYTESYYGYPH